MILEVCVLGSGSSGNATYIGTERTKLLVDCGLPAREIVRRLQMIDVEPAELSAVLISHAHIDHFYSAGTIHARFDVPVHTSRRTDAAIHQRGGYTSFRRIAETRPIPKIIGNIGITTFPVPHGGHGGPTGEPVGFVFEHRQTKVVHLTDLGSVSASLYRYIRNANCFVIEANYHEPVVHSKLRDIRYAADWGYLKWVASSRGHLSNQQCSETLSRAVGERTTDIFLAHISENHTDPQKDNNDFYTAMSVVSNQLKRVGKNHPKIHRTYRRGRIESKPSDIVRL